MRDDVTHDPNPWNHTGIEVATPGGMILVPAMTHTKLPLPGNPVEVPSE